MNWRWCHTKARTTNKKLRSKKKELWKELNQITNSKWMIWNTLIQTLNMILNMGFVLTTDSRCDSHAFYYFIFKYDVCVCVWLVFGERFSTENGKQETNLNVYDVTMLKTVKARKMSRTIPHPSKLRICNLTMWVEFGFWN